MGDGNQEPDLIQVIEAARRRRRRRRAPLEERRRERRQQRQQNRQQDNVIELEEDRWFPELAGFPDRDHWIFYEIRGDPMIGLRAQPPQERHRIGNQIDRPYFDDDYVVSDSEDEVMVADIPRDVVEKPEIFEALETLVREKHRFNQRHPTLLLDPVNFIYNAVKAYNIPEGKGVAAAHEAFYALQALAKTIQKAEPPRAQLLDRRPGEFQLPRAICDNLSKKEIQILEACIDVLRNAMINGMPFPGYEAIEDIVVYVRSCCRSDDLLEQGRLTELVEMFVETDDYMRRQAEYQAAVYRRQLVGYRRSKRLRLPESTNYHTPHIPKDDFELWKEADIKDWIKLFIHKKEHRALIECQHFSGYTLQMFLISNETWKEHDWPFGLFIKLKIHFNRVANHRNGHVHQFR